MYRYIAVQATYAYTL